MATMTQDGPFWDRYARKYAKMKIRDEAAYAHTLERTLSHLPKEARVLELGGGTGTTALKLADHVASYTGTDISAEMTAIAEEKLAAARQAEPGRYPGLTFRQAPVDASAFAGERPDAVLAFNILHLVPDLRLALRDVRAQLPEGGLFISKTPCLGRKAWHFRVLIAVLRMVGKAPSHVTLMDVEQLDAAVRAAGFEIVETGVFPRKPPSRFLVARAV